MTPFIKEPPCGPAQSAAKRLTVLICNTGETRWTTDLRARPPGIIKQQAEPKAALPADHSSEIPPFPADAQHAVPFLLPLGLAAGGKGTLIPSHYDSTVILPHSA